LEQLYPIGVHARDVIGRHAGACQSLAWVFPEIDLLWVELRPWIDPWGPWDPKHLKKSLLPWFDPQPLVDIAIGGAVAALRETFPAFSKIDVLYKESVEIVRKATAGTFGRALWALGNDQKSIDQLLATGRKRMPD
jgi:hypothetical protein